MAENMRPEEQEEILQLWLESMAAAHPFLPRACFEVYLPLIRQNYTPDFAAFTVKENGAIVGFACVVEKRLLGTVAVRPDRQGCGIGSDLLAACLEKTPVLEAVVYVKNANAVKFFENRGFQIVKEQTGLSTGAAEYVLSIK